MHSMNIKKELRCVNPSNINPLNAQLNPIYHLLALLGAHPILHVSRIRVKVKLVRFSAYRAVNTLYRRYKKETS
jgi:hypothetical protein